MLIIILAIFPTFVFIPVSVTTASPCPFITIVVAIMGFIGICIKNVIKKISDDKTKEQVCKTVVKAVEQMYSDLTGDERYEKAVEGISEMLAEKGISATELEVKMLIESAVKEMNINLGKTGAKENADN